ncbi:hypothetical protein [Aquibacillus halophilus]|nr:hypothetical protein [Aquibacillus halophilus]
MGTVRVLPLYDTISLLEIDVLGAKEPSLCSFKVKTIGYLYITFGGIAK